MTTENCLCECCEDVALGPGETLCEMCAWLAEMENSPDSRIATCRRILTDGFEKIGGYVVDLTTASLLVQCYEKMQPRHRKAFETAPFARVVDACWKAVR